MPGIWNIGNGYNVNSKKVSSKLTFKPGETFTGRVVSKGDGKDITIKLSDGWQFIAELEGNVNTEDIKLVKFQVEGFENGKLKLKIVSDSSAKSSSDVDEEFSELIEKENLSKDDVSTLKLMVKHRIPLTKENIARIKGLIQLNEKINNSENFADDFIENYILEKGIDVNSSESDLIRNQLGKFFEVFKGMSNEDILTFIENNIELNDENIESFNKLFKGDSSLEKILSKIGEALKEAGIKEGFKNEELIINNKSIQENGETNKEVSRDINSMAAKTYNNLGDSSSKKLNLMELLKTISGSNDGEVISTDKNMSTLVNKLNDNELMLLFKDVKYDSSEITNQSLSNDDIFNIQTHNKSEFELALTNVEGREIKLTDEQFKKINSLFENKLREDLGIYQNKGKDTAELNNKTVNETIKNIMINKDIVKSEIKGQIENTRDIVRNLIMAASSSKEDAVYEKVMNLINNNMSNFKVFNAVSDQYYCLNFPVNMINKEYPCKLIIKDSRKEGKKIDKTHVKMVVSVKTINLGEIDGYLTIHENRINVNLKCENNFTSILEKNKVKLSDGLRLMGLVPDITVSIKEQSVDLVSCRDFFNDKFTSAIDIRV